MRARRLWRKCIEIRFENALIRTHRHDDAHIARTFERIEPLPMRRQIRRLEEVHRNIRSVLIENETWIAEGRAPPTVIEMAANDALQPASFERRQFVVIGFAFPIAMVSASRSRQVREYRAMFEG